jgi:RNA polymerase subunit RPABC4/transcription elongation factor Spt4
MPSLSEQFPKIFAVCGVPESQEGWNGLLEAACERIQRHIDHSRAERARALRVYRGVKRARSTGDTSTLRRALCPSRPDSDFAKDWAQRKILSDEVLEPPKEACEQVVALQIKEKFGTLRFYHSGGDAFVEGVLEMAEAMSARTCEVCGAPGSLLEGHGWYRVRCKTCAK